MDMIHPFEERKVVLGVAFAARLPPMWPSGDQDAGARTRGTSAESRRDRGRLRVR